jgi:hypothetical protein
VQNYAQFRPSKVLKSFKKIIVPVNSSPKQTVIKLNETNEGSPINKS